MKESEDRIPPIEEELMAPPTEASLGLHVTDLLLGRLRDVRWAGRPESTRDQVSIAIPARGGSGRISSLATHRTEEERTWRHRDLRFWGATVRG
jgi:hypothetical protein